MDSGVATFGHQNRGRILVAIEVLGSVAALHLINGQLIISVAICGTFAFGISGGLAGAQARLDIFGVGVVAAIVSLSGGVLRDGLLDTRPLVVFDWSVVTSVACAGSGVLPLSRPAR